MRGTTGDVLSGGAVDVTGGAAAPGAVGLTVICVVALLALMTGGRVIRSASAVVMVVSALGALAVTAFVAMRPREVVGSALSQQLARTTAPDATGRHHRMGLACCRRCRGPRLRHCGRSDLEPGLVRPVCSLRAGTKPASGPRGEVRTTWDELSEGHDPTLRDEPDRT